MKNKVFLSICVPAFNEEGGLRAAVEDLLSTLSSVAGGLEIIIVDDGSKDATGRIAFELAERYAQVRVISHNKNLGIGASYRDALAVAVGRFYTWFPADHENSAAEFKVCLPHLSESAIVACHHRGQDPRSLARRVISRIYTWFLNGFFRLNLKYYNGLAIFPAVALRPLSLKANGFLILSESLIKAARRGLRVIELPVALKVRGSGRSKAFNLSEISQMASDITRILPGKDI
ncbi:MAG: glycosyltransferase family 2 protein [Candidatus Omnitrophota bacterium]|jgi:glycosyltransferase involved in cell wall biosynthesis